MEKLTIQEEEVMIYVWELQSCFVKDIVAKYPQPAPPYTTEMCIRDSSNSSLLKEEQLTATKFCLLRLLL